ncbi:MAG: hypothetical protein ACR2RE_09175 [Geminicoccaceae bacterium]
MANQLFEDIADARFAALSNRFQASDEEADIVRRQIAKVLEAQQTTELAVRRRSACPGQAETCSRIDYGIS